MRVLMTTHRGAGHFGPMVPFANALLRAGHELLFAAPRSAAPMIARAGLDHHLLDEPSEEQEAPLWAAIRAASPDGAAELVMGQVFGGVRARAMLPGMLDLVAGWEPDAVVHEISEIAGAAAAARYGVPHARLGIGLAVGEHWGVQNGADLLNPPLARLCRSIGAPAVRLERTPYLTLAPPSIEVPSPLPRRALRFRAPVATPRPLPDWWGGSRDPLLYVSFGTAVPQERDFRAVYGGVVEAVADLPMRVLLTIGDDHDPAELGALPPSVHVERWVPQADVMPHAAAMVGHGGSGSTLIALAAGVPLVLVPFFADQPNNAERVAQLGAGVALEGGAAAAAALPNAVRAVIEDPAYRRVAGRLAAEVAGLPPVDAAVGVLEELAGGRALAA